MISMASFAQAEGLPLERFLPTPGFTSQWHLEEQIKMYTQDDLFTYINGEAELFFPYGFERLASAFYTKKEGDPPIGLVADIYKMGSLLDAFGIYSQFRKPDAEFIPMGAEGFVHSSQLMFYQDRYFVQLSASGISQLDRSVFESCAQAISKALPGPPVKPLELDLLKIPALIPQTERYFPESLLGYSFFHRGLIALASHEGKKFRVFVIKENSAEAAEKTVEAYVRYVKDSGITANKTTDPEGMILFTPDPLHKALMLRQKGRYIVGVTDVDMTSQGTFLVKQLMGRLNE